MSKLKPLKKGVVLILALAFTLMNSWAQEDEILLTIDNTSISRAEFERIYKKNNENLFDESDSKTPEEYLDLFINYKLKVLEAIRLKMDTAEAFKNELESYRKELAAPYLTDIQHNDDQVKKMYNRMTKEVNASHILLRLEPNATALESREVLERIGQIRNEILNGKDFNEAARAYSEDPSAKMNGGNLGYFTAFQMVGPFEDAAFSLNPGEISEPVRTSFGYHLLKVHDVRDNRGEIHVAHIMKMFPQNEQFDKKKLKTEIDSIYTLLEQGESFEDLAKKLSDDKPTASTGGVMPWFSAGRMIPAFAEPAFELQNNGDFSKPVETPYGFHIIKKLEHKPVPPFESMKKEIEARIKKDPSRSLSSKKVFIEKLKQEYNFKENSANINKLENVNIGDNLAYSSLILFTIKDHNYQMADFNQYLKKHGFTQGAYMLHWEDWVEAEITALEEGLLEQKHPDFKYLMQEYHDGILLFNIMEEKIWNFAAQDSAGLEQFYKNSKNKHMWGERFRGSIITAQNAQAREDADKYFAAGMPADEVSDLINKKGNAITITTGIWEKGSEKIVDYFVWNGPQPDGFNPELTFIRGDLEKPAPKTLNDARGLYISDYQNHLEKEWLKELRKRYKIKVNKKLLKEIPDA